MIQPRRPISHNFAQAVHEWMQEIDPNHDTSSCVCCCLDCADMYADVPDKPCGPPPLEG